MPFDFDAAVHAPFRMQPGLRRMAEGASALTPSLPPSGGAARHLREKLAVLGAFAPQALCGTPGFDASPALHALAHAAARWHPQALRLDGPPAQATWQAPALGWALTPGLQPLPLESGHGQGHAPGGHRAPATMAHAAAAAGPGRDAHVHTAWPEVGRLLGQLPPVWRRAALLALAFEEDLAIVDATPGAGGRIPWLAVALPSAWAPEDKVGRPFAEVHAPVADNRLLLAAADRLVALVAPQAGNGEGHPPATGWERFVWTLTPHPRLHAHPQRLPPRDGPEGWPAHAQGDGLAALTWWRTEHQRFMPVPGQRQAVFTIQVQTRPLAQAIASPDQARRLHDALASMSAAVLAYRGLGAVQPRLLAWLAGRAGA